MRQTNDARGGHTYRLANGNPKPGRIGLPARVDNAANQEQVLFFCSGTAGSSRSLLRRREVNQRPGFWIIKPKGPMMMMS